jgi:hypothetical protein
MLLHLVKIKAKYQYRFNIDINSRTGVGSFKLQMGSFEYSTQLSSLDINEIDVLDTKARKYSGLLIFRDNLRVLPYGRVDNDFFRIEERRSFHAGRYYWSNRRIFRIYRHFSRGIRN